jgi:hypothetical protein
MNPEVKKKWIAALRSGEYKQGKYRLWSYVDTYCCLGVLCDLHAKETGNEWVEHVGHEYLGQRTSLPAAVCKWAGVPTLTGYGGGITAIIDGQPKNLIVLNDADRYSFAQIADVIEKGL